MVGVHVRADGDYNRECGRGNYSHDNCAHVLFGGFGPHLVGETLYRCKPVY